VDQAGRDAHEQSVEHGQQLQRWQSHATRAEWVQCAVCQEIETPQQNTGVQRQHAMSRKHESKLLQLLAKQTQHAAQNAASASASAAASASSQTVTHGQADRVLEGEWVVENELRCKYCPAFRINQHNKER